MDPEFERRLSKPNSGCIRAMSNGIMASPMSPNGTPTKGVRSSPATPMSSVNPDFPLYFQSNCLISHNLFFFCSYPVQKIEQNLQ